MLTARGIGSMCTAAEDVPLLELPWMPPATEAAAVEEEVEPPLLPPASHFLLDASMKILWRLPRANEQKETFWRLAINGVSATGGHGIVPAGPCMSLSDGSPPLQ